MSTAPICRFESVSKKFIPRFGPRIRALTNLSFDLYPGEVLGLLGPPGSGKSTIIRLLSGKLRPSSGRIWRGDEQILLLDEPTEAPLRPPDGAAVLATQSTARAHRFCTRVLLLDQGESLGWLPAEQLGPWVAQPWYRVRLQEHLTERMLHGLGELSCRYTREGQTELTGPVPDAAALYGLLRRLERFNLVLLEVAEIDPLASLLQEFRASLTPGPG